MISFDNISHSYETEKIISNVSFNVQHNEVVSLLGPSGCGKTTLLRLAAGLETPDAGLIKLNEKIISSPGFLILLRSFFDSCLDVEPSFLALESI